MSEITVPYLNFSTQHLPLQDEFVAAFREITRTGQFILGPYVEAFERNFADFCGANSCIAVNSGTSALHLSLLAADIGPGDEVITTPSTFVATVAAIAYTGATPVLVDIDPETYCIDPKQIPAAITGKTRAIIPVHLYGLVADMSAINAIANKHRLVVIEDAAQAHGAKWQDKTAGSLGDIAAFSFYPGKNLGAFGEGGAITTNNTDMAALVRSLRDWGQSGKGNHVHPAYNYRMDAIQGAALNIKLPELEAWTKQRSELAERYNRAFARLPVKRQHGPDPARSAWHVYSILHEDRAGLQSYLQEKGIQSGIHYPQAVHQSPAYHYLGYKQGDFPNAEKLSAEELSLPIFPGMTEVQINLVIEAVREFVAS